MKNSQQPNKQDLRAPPTATQLLAGSIPGIGQINSGNLAKVQFKLLPLKPTIKFADLDKVDIRVGLIEKVTDIERSDKLVKLLVNFGEFTRTIVVGLKKERTNPKDIEGKQALFVVNLEPKTMLGETSEGMLFDIGYANGITPVLALPEKPVPNGVSAG